MTFADPDIDAIGRLIDRHIAEPPESEAFARSVRAGLEVAAAALDDLAALPTSRSARARLSIVLSKAAEKLRAHASLREVPR